MTFAGFTLGNYYYTCRTDAAHPCIYLQKNEVPRAVLLKNGNVVCPKTNAIVGLMTVYCDYCKKSVDDYQFHSKWLNTCIGQANYEYYLNLILGVILTTLLHLVVNIAIMVAMIKDINTVVDAHERLYGE